MGVLFWLPAACNMADALFGSFRGEFEAEQLQLLFKKASLLACLSLRALKSV